MRNFLFAALLTLGIGSAVAQTPQAGALYGVPVGVPPGTDISSAVVRPTGAITPATAAALAAQQGVLLDTFKCSGQTGSPCNGTTDPDDTASMVRAVAAGVPILLGPKTYTINNYTMAGTPAQFVLQGVKGKSIVQRTSASGSQFFSISAANVAIDGVTFDMNKTAVTGNQWGVFLGSGGQIISITNSTFKNNSGTLSVGLGILATSASDGGSYNISGNEFTSDDGAVGGALYFGTASHGVVFNNFVHDNAGNGIFAQTNGTVSGTNYITDVLISSNKIERNGNTGIAVGGYSAPYSFAAPPATYISITNNVTVDNAEYGIFLGGDYISISGNQVFQSSPSVVVYGGIDGNGRYSSLQNNTVTLNNSGWGIDIGGATQFTLQGNVVTMTTAGTGLNVGGNINSKVSENHIIVAGSAVGITDYAVESGGNAVFPNLASGTVIEDNTIDMNGSGTQGILLLDNPGGYSGTTGQVVRHNSFNGSNSANVANAIIWYGSNSSLTIDGNLWNGSNKMFSDPVGNPGSVFFENLYFGGTVSGAGSTNTALQIVPHIILTYGSGGSVLYLTPTSGGSNYTAATVINFSGGCTATATPQIISGVIVGTRMTGFGTGCSGTTASTSDTGGGSGAVFTVGNVPKLPTASSIIYQGQSNYLLQHSGGAVSINSPPFVMVAGGSVQLQALSNDTWALTSSTIPQVLTSVLTAIGCGATSLGANAIATDALTPTYLGILIGGGTSRAPVSCDGTNFRTN